MKVNLMTPTLYGSLLLSVLLHLMMFLTITMVWVGQVKQEKQEERPNLYIPSYTYNEEAAASAPVSSQPTETPKQPEQKIADSIATKNVAPLPKERPSHTSQPSPNSEAIHLLGDQKKMPKPIIKILGKAITAHLIYPKIAVDFKVKGTVYVAFVLHPDGQLSNIQVVQSSRAGILDEQALLAVTGASPLKNISKYVTEPKPMVIGIIFR